MEDTGKNSVHVRYLLTSEQDMQWGLTINTVGYQHVAPGEFYPPQNHPSRYLFSTERGRVLDEYQLLYLVRGKGRFASASHRDTEVHEGQMFMLFPGEWHSYRPDPKTGWDEYWIGFEGEYIDNRTARGFFSRQKPIFNVGLHEEVASLYRTAIKTATNQHTGFQQMLDGIVNHLLGYAYSYDKRSTMEEKWAVQQINKAKITIYESLSQRLSPEEIAAQLNVSYSWFRRVFKQYTGFSPTQYMLEMKVQKSKELLTNTDLSSREIAYRLGFENPDYFCLLFRKRTGITPIRFRKFTQGSVYRL
jgi:AraC-like DNA-binding protein